MELGKAQKLYDELMKLESKLRDIRYDTGPSLEDEVQTLQYKLAEYQLELETTLDNVRDVLRPSIEADIAASLPDNELDELDESRALDAMAATITATSETPVDTDSQQMDINLSGDVAITRDPYDVFIR